MSYTAFIYAFFLYKLHKINNGYMVCLHVSFVEPADDFYELGLMHTGQV